MSPDFLFFFLIKVALATPKLSLFSKSYRSVAFFGGKVFAKWVKMLDKKGGGGKIGYQKIFLVVFYVDNFSK